MTLDLPYPWIEDEQVQGNFDRIRTEWPSAIYAPGDVVTALPATGQDGQVVRYLANATDGVVWTFRYRAAASSSYKWEFAGGGALYAVDANTRNTSSSTFQTTGSPTVTVPLAGEYIVTWGTALATNQAAAVNQMEVGLYANAAQVDVAYVISTDQYDGAPAGGVFRSVIGASQAFDVRYRSQAAQSATFYTMRLSVVPVRVS